MKTACRSPWPETPPPSKPRIGHLLLAGCLTPAKLDETPALSCPQALPSLPPPQGIARLGAGKRTRFQHKGRLRWDLTQVAGSWGCSGKTRRLDKGQPARNGALVRMLGGSAHNARASQVFTVLTTPTWGQPGPLGYGSGAKRQPAEGSPSSGLHHPAEPGITITKAVAIAHWLLRATVLGARPLVISFGPHSDRWGHSHLAPFGAVVTEAGAYPGRWQPPSPRAQHSGADRALGTGAKVTRSPPLAGSLPVLSHADKAVLAGGAASADPRVPSDARQGCDKSPAKSRTSRLPD